jgi:hypothetical protein
MIVDVTSPQPYAGSFAVKSIAPLRTAEPPQQWGMVTVERSRSLTQSSFKTALTTPKQPATASERYRPSLVHIVYLYRPVSHHGLPQLL